MSDAHPPGPPPRRAGLASVPYYLRFATDPIGFVGRRFAEYGDIYYAPSGGTGLYVLRHPDDLLQVLATDSSSYAKTHSALARLERVLGRGLLTLDGNDWKRHRRMIQPAFNRRALRTYAEAMVVEVDAMLERWGGSTQIDAAEQMTELTLRIVTRTLFSHDVAGEAGDVAAAMRVFNSALSRPDLLPPWMPSPARNRIERSTARLDAIIYALIDARAGSSSESGADDLLQTLLDAVDDGGDGGDGGDGEAVDRGGGGKLTRREIRDELVTLFLAGHETTANALSWTLYLLARNPEVRRRLVAEIDGVLAGRAPTVEDLERLPLLDQVFREALRLYPPAYAITRGAIRDTTIGEYAVPAGSEVVMWIYWAHRDPRWYPDPDAFSPDRFAPDAVADRPKMAYLPFGGGPRACIGAQFSLLEARLILARLLSRVRLELASRRVIRPRTGVTLRPRHGLPMRVDPRRP